MTVTDITTVDAIGIDRITGEVVLTIADHLDWQRPHEHLSILQAKLNGYAAFIESGELMTAYRDAEDRRRRIDVVFKFEPTEGALRFLNTAKGTLRAATISLTWCVFNPSDAPDRQIKPEDDDGDVG